MRDRMSWLFRTTLSARLTLYYSALMTLTLIAFAFLVFISFDTSIHNQFDAGLEHEAVEFANSIILHARDSLDFSSPLVEEHEEIIRTVRAHTVQVIARSGKRLFRSKNDPPEGFPSATIPDVKSRLSVEEETLPDGRERRMLYYPYYYHERLLAWVQVAAFEGVVQDAVTSLKLILFLGGGILVIGAGLAGYFLAKRSLFPLNAIAVTASAVTSATLSERIDVSMYRDREIVTIADGLNQLLARLEHSFENIARFTSDAAHELLTPLTILKQEIEVSLRKPRSDSEYRETLLRLSADAERMTRIVRSLLSLARTDRNELSTRVRVALKPILKEECAKYTTRAVEKRLMFTTQFPEQDSVVVGYESHLHAIVGNLLDNAMKYTFSGGTVAVELATLGSACMITVRDTGIGMDAEESKHAFDRFYRSTRALEADPEGNGLGLAIVKSFVEAAGGTICFDSSPGTGTTVRVSFPVVTAGEQFITSG